MRKITRTNGDSEAMKQFIVLGIFILIGVIVYANVFESGGKTVATTESINASYTVTNTSYTVAFGAYMYETPVIDVFADGTEVAGTGAGTNYSIDYSNGNLTIWETADTRNTAITATYSYSSSGSASGKSAIDQLNTTWYNSVNLLIIVFLVISAVVILAYVGRIGGGGQ